MLMTVRRYLLQVFTTYEKIFELLDVRELHFYNPSLNHIFRSISLDCASRSYRPASGD